MKLWNKYIHFKLNKYSLNPNNIYSEGVVNFLEIKKHLMISNTNEKNLSDVMKKYYIYNVFQNFLIERAEKYYFKRWHNLLDNKIKLFGTKYLKLNIYLDLDMNLVENAFFFTNDNLDFNELLFSKSDLNSYLIELIKEHNQLSLNYRQELLVYYLAEKCYSDLHNIRDLRDLSLKILF